MKYQVLVNSNKGYIVRIYVEGHDGNLAAFEEEIADEFESICQHYGDDPSRCKLVGEAQWKRLRFTPSRMARITDDGDGVDVTMIRVHRATTPSMGKR